MLDVVIPIADGTNKLGHIVDLLAERDVVVDAQTLASICASSCLGHQSA